jgi:phosphoketolase
MSAATQPNAIRLLWVMVVADFMLIAVYCAQSIGHALSGRRGLAAIYASFAVIVVGLVVYLIKMIRLLTTPMASKSNSTETYRRRP